MENERSPRQTFTCTSYNILAQSLGSNCAPWILAISNDWIERLGQQQWSDVKATLKTTYLSHFHKNTWSEEDPKDYQTMRALWSTTKLKSSIDIPPALAARINFETQWTISYIKPGNESEERFHAKTMGGVLSEMLGEVTGQELFEHVLAKENSIFHWNVRGPKIFQRVTSSLQTDSNVDLGTPDVIFLQEYDCDQLCSLYTGNSNYSDGGGKVGGGAAELAAEETTFRSAMSSKGYDGLFFPGANRVAGLGLFWKRDVFALDATKESQDFSPVVFLNESIVGTAFNYDLHEHWHPAPDNEEKEKEDDEVGDNNSSGSLMPTMDRKNVAMVRLRHKLGGRQVLWVVCHHGMTDSRDNAKCTRFPGEVRSHELFTISRLVEKHVRKDQHMVIMGDFNVDVGEIAVLSGNLQRRRRSNEGDCDDSKRRRVGKEMLRIETGYDEDESCFRWRKCCGGMEEEEEEDKMMVLRDAFLPVHQRRSHATVPGRVEEKDRLRFEHATSHNNKRREFIDQCWYDERLNILGVSDTKIPWEAIPNYSEPSDHVPISVKFEFDAATFDAVRVESSMM